jgi:hypothetical protein
MLIGTGHGSDDTHTPRCSNLVPPPRVRDIPLHPHRLLNNPARRVFLVRAYHHPKPRHTNNMCQPHHNI